MVLVIVEMALKEVLVKEVSIFMQICNNVCVYIILDLITYIWLTENTATCATTVVPIIQTQTSQRTLSFNSGNSIYQNIHLTGTTQYTSVSMITSTTDLSNTPQCSGHGICKTMREAGAEFNGMSVFTSVYFIMDD